jgi:CRP-like cAMP-binding protein
MNMPADQTQQLKTYELFLMGHPICKDYSSSSKLYIVVEGEVAIFLGHELIATINPGEFLDGALLSKLAPSELNIIARTNCQLVAIEPAMAAALASHPPEFAIQIVRAMVERLTRQLEPPVQLSLYVVSRRTRTRSSSSIFKLCSM